LTNGIKFRELNNACWFLRSEDRHLRHGLKNLFLPQIGKQHWRKYRSLYFVLAKEIVDGRPRSIGSSNPTQLSKLWKENMTEHPEARPVSQILETLALSKERPTTPPQDQNFNESEKLLKQRAWLDKWLRLRITHPQLRAAETQIHKACSHYAKFPSQGETIVIFGENGCGKTHIAKRIFYWANRIAMNLPQAILREDEFGPPSVVIANWPRIVDGFKRDQWAAVDDLESSTMTIIDDIGAEHDPSRIGVEKLYMLLSRREFKWNIVTTNVSPGAWDEKFERRIASRLFRNAQHIDLSQVPDYSTT
jgi:DNA replication protein DnaC